MSGGQLRRVLDGVDADGRLLRDSSTPVKVAGYDLTFSASKSVLFGLGGQEVREAVRQAHDKAVAAAMGHMERGGSGRQRPRRPGRRAGRRPSGRLAPAPHVADRGSAAAHARGGGEPRSRSGRAVVDVGWPADLFAGADGELRLPGRARSELSRELGVRWTPVRRGIAEIAGVPRPVLRAFSRRRAEIEAELERHGLRASGQRGRRLGHARAQGPLDRPGTAQAEWRDRAQELGFGLEQLETVLGRRRELERPVDWERVFDTLASPVGLTRAQSTFDRRDVIQALCERLPAGTVTDARLLEAAADRFLASDRTVALLPDGETFRRADGRLLRSRASSAALLHARVARPGAAAHRPRHHPANLADAVRRRGGRCSAAIGRRPTLSGEQQQMVEHVCRSPARVVVVAGKAGTGKTFALAAAREAWQQAGHPVLGVAVARRAARELTAGAGIEATSTAALLHDVHNGRPLPKGCVLVVDEAGMVATRQLAELLEHVERADGKLVPSAITPAARDRGRRRVPRRGRPRARGRAGSQPAPGGSVGTARARSCRRRSGR